MRRIAFLLLDRDGTVIKDKHYLSEPRGVALLPGVGEALGGLARQGMSFFLVSNQSGVGRGMFSPDAVEACNARLAELLLPYGVSFADMLYCPHRPEDGCDCRKPRAGMWRELAERHALDPAAGLMVGDKQEDMLFASASGLALRALVLTGKGVKTAAAQDISLPDNNFFSFTMSPASEAHPHLLLPSLAMLPKALDVVMHVREGT